jgi:hypothetical protein
MGDYQLIQQYPADRRLTFHILSHISWNELNELYMV